MSSLQTQFCVSQERRLDFDTGQCADAQQCCSVLARVRGMPFRTW